MAEALGAGAVGAGDPGDAYAGAEGEFRSVAPSTTVAYDLVAGDEVGLRRAGRFALEDVEVGAANSAGEDAEEEMVGGDGGAGTSSMLRGWDGRRIAAFMGVSLVPNILARCLSSPLSSAARSLPFS